VRIQTNPDKMPKAKDRALAAPARRRMGVVERERQILDGAIQFFAVHGFGGQLRDLAKSIGVTHALLYHYFPTKQALIDRVYLEVFEGRWRAEWGPLLDNTNMTIEDKLTVFYQEYVTITLSKEFVRILVFSGLTDHTITDRFFTMLRVRLFPRLIRETRRFRGLTSRAKPSEREMELLMGLHGGFFYISMRRWIYVQDVYSDSTHEGYDEHLVRDRVRAYLHASRDLFADTTGRKRSVQL
jgi:AcrR family transcriptional regulator